MKARKETRLVSKRKEREQQRINAGKRRCTSTPSEVVLSHRGALHGEVVVDGSEARAETFLRAKGARVPHSTAPREPYGSRCTSLPFLVVTMAEDTNRRVRCRNELELEPPDHSNTAYKINTRSILSPSLLRTVS
jgi:hypothetical protein